MSQPSQGQTKKLEKRTPELVTRSALDVLLERSADPTFLIDGNRFVNCNQAAVEMIRMSGKSDVLLRHPSDFSPQVQPDGQTSLERANEMVARALSTGSQRFEWVFERSDNSLFPVEILLTAIPQDGKQILFAVCRDISRIRNAELDRFRAEEALLRQTQHDLTERRKEDAFRAGQSRVLEMIATAAPLSEVLIRLVTLIQEQSDGMVCSILLLSDDGKHVRHGAAPSLPEIYVKAVDGAPIGPKNGSCGTAMYLGKPVIVTDMLADPLWEDYRELAALSGLRACWSTPILSGPGKVLGSFAMYYREPRAPSDAESQLTDVATHIAGIAIEHQRAEAELRASEERFGKAFNANPHPMSLTTLEEGRILEVNESFIELSGYARPELIGRTSLEAIWELPLSRAALVRRVREQGVVRNIEARIRTKTGKSRTVLFSSLMVEIGGQDCLLSVSNDITERRRTEEQLSLLQAITMEVAVAQDLASALEVVCRRVCETTGWVLGQSWVPHEDGTSLECCTAWFTSADGLREFRLGSENTRFPPGVGLPGRVWSSKQPAWIRDVTIDNNFPRAVLARESGLKAAFALPIVSADEVIAVIEFFLREPQDEDDRLVKVVAAIAAQLGLAIERKRAEEQLRRTQGELVHVTRVTTMGELAASIAHEVNQPLGAIVGNADICLNWLAQDQPKLDLLREALEDIASDGRRASEVTNRIRGLVRKNLPQKTIFSINDVVREVQALMEHQMQREGVALAVELGYELPLVQGDRVQLQQVLLNLLMNGVDALSEVEQGSRALKVTTSCKNPREILISIRDCGIGIRAQDAEQIFKPFHTTKSGGMGMGLAISRSIIEAHGGRLWAEPNQGPGATFNFTLPARSEEAE
jgi:PAS domain S-box-containing protein